MELFRENSSRLKVFPNIVNVRLGSKYLSETQCIDATSEAKLETCGTFAMKLSYNS